MQSVQWNSVGNETSGEPISFPRHPVASATASETASEKAHSDQQPAVSEDIYAAFTWLFGSGCY